jgi:hypothetical protein
VVEIEPQRRERYLNGRAMHFCPSVPRNYLYHSEEDAADHATHSRASMLKHYFSGFEECLVECNPLKPSLLELARQAFSRRQSNALMCRGAQIVPASDLQTLDDHLLEDRGADAVAELCLESSLSLLATAAAMLGAETTCLSRAPHSQNLCRTSAARFPYLHISSFELR